MIQEYHAIMQTKILKEYTFYPVGFIIVYTSKLFPTEQLLFISFPFFSIQYFNYSGKIYKNCNLWSNSLVKYIFGYQNHQLKNWQALVKKPWHSQFSQASLDWQKLHDNPRFLRYPLTGKKSHDNPRNLRNTIVLSTLE